MNLTNAHQQPSLNLKNEKQILTKALAIHTDRKNAGYLLIIILELFTIATAYYNRTILKENIENWILFFIVTQIFALSIFINTFLKYHRITKKKYTFGLNLDDKQFQENETFRILLNVLSTQNSTSSNTKNHTLYSSGYYFKTKKLADQLSPYYHNAYKIKLPGMLFPKKLTGNSNTTSVCLICGKIIKPANLNCPRCKTIKIS